MIWDTMYLVLTITGIFLAVVFVVGMMELETDEKTLRDKNKEAKSLHLKRLNQQEK